MAENTSVIDLKKRKLKEELDSENPDRNKIRRFKDSIKRHKDIARHIRNRRMRNRRRQR